MNIVEQINLLTTQYKTKYPSKSNFSEEPADLSLELVTLKKTAGSSSISISRPTYANYLRTNGIPFKYIEIASICHLENKAFALPKKEESWRIVTTQEGKSVLWIRCIQHETRIQMEKLYNSPIVLRSNPLGHNKIITFDIFQETVSWKKYYASSEQIATPEQIEEIKQSWKTGIVKQIKEDKTINGISLSDIINAYPISSNKSEDVFKILCESKRAKGKLSDKERNTMLVYGFTLKQINEAIGYVKPPHKPHSKRSDIGKKHTFTDETKAKLNTYHLRKIEQSDIQDVMSEQEIYQVHMDKIEQL